MKRPGVGNLRMWQDWDELLTELRAVPGIDAVDAWYWIQGIGAEEMPFIARSR